MQENFETTTATSVSGSSSPGRSEAFLSLAEAAKLAGVSTSTLLRFSEAGYFRTYQNNGDSKFSRMEIFQVFGPVLQEDINITEGAQEQQPAQQEQEINTAVTAAESPTAESPTAESPTTVEPVTAEETQSLNLSPEQSQTTTEAPLSSKIEKFIDHPAEKDDSRSLEPFKQVLQLQEELLSQKSKMITELTKERDWLRTRLEKMEEKADKDQMLLMVESQKVRTLLGQDSMTGSQGNKQNGLGFFNRALAWFNQPKAF